METSSTVSDAGDDQIIELYETEGSVERVARRLLVPRWTVRKTLERAGIRAGRGRYPRICTQQRDRQIIHLHQQGMKSKVIASLFGLAVENVNRIIRAHK